MKIYFITYSTVNDNVDRGMLVRLTDTNKRYEYIINITPEMLLEQAQGKVDLIKQLSLEKDDGKINIIQQIDF